MISALHLSPNGLFNTHKIETYESESFSPLLAEARTLNQKVETHFKVSDDIEGTITETANKGDYDLLLVGTGHSIYKGSLLGNILGYSSNILNPDNLLNKVSGKEGLFKTLPFAESTRKVLAKSKIPVGILIDADLQQINKVLVPVFDNDDRFLADYARKLISNAQAQITALDMNGHMKGNLRIKEAFNAIEQFAPDHVAMHELKNFDQEALKTYDLIVISLDSWLKFVGSKNEWLMNIPSVLILSA
jgi:nucleotide-binding universal stress UspA family protein